MTNQEKGDILEEMTKNIENLILQNSPGLNASKYHISLKYEEIRYYEIDLYIKIDLEDGSQKVYIVECKNWDSQKIERKHITDFSEKIKVSNAEKGLYYGKRFTEGAKWRIEQEQKIIKVEVENTSIPPFLFWEASYVNQVGIRIFLKPKIIYDKSFLALSRGSGITVEYYEGTELVISAILITTQVKNKIIHQLSITNNRTEQLDGVQMRIVDFNEEENQQ